MYHTNYLYKRNSDSSDERQNNYISLKEADNLSNQLETFVVNFYLTEYPGTSIEDVTEMRACVKALNTQQAIEIVEEQFNNDWLSTSGFYVTKLCANEIFYGCTIDTYFQVTDYNVFNERETRE